MQLPKHILSGIITNRTSLGDNPALPDSKNNNDFIIELLKKRFKYVCSKIHINNIDLLEKKHNELITLCNKIESNNKEALEQLCFTSVIKLFNIEENLLTFNIKLSDNIDISGERMTPEKNIDFSFKNKNDIEDITNEIYKRRMMNAIIAGASEYYSNAISMFITQLSDINPKLPLIYKEILEIEDVLIFFQKEKITTNDTEEYGKVDVYISNEKNNPSKIVAEGIIFPILLRETIKGILEFYSAQGLPDDLERAKYIIKKSDFKLADKWDNRFGYPLWEIIIKNLEHNNIDIKTIGINFLFSEISKLSVKEFNKMMNNILSEKNIKDAKFLEIVKKIQHDKDYNDFTNYIKVKNEKFQLNDSECFSPKELSNEINETE